VVRVIAAHDDFACEEPRQARNRATESRDSQGAPVGARSGVLDIVSLEVPVGEESAHDCSLQR
jgi:hypothetical protein